MGRKKERATQLGDFCLLCVCAYLCGTYNKNTLKLKKYSYIRRKCITTESWSHRFLY